MIRAILAFIGLVVVAPAGAQEKLQSIASGFGSGRMPCGSCAAPEGLTSVAEPATASEPGQRITITGHVFEADGQTPAVGVTLFVYQTDASGHYNRQDDPYQPRLRGWLRTGAGGAYVVHTIRPGPYPNHSEPAHLHVHAFGPGRAERFLGDLWFSGDALLRPAALERSKAEGRFGQVLELRTDADGLTQAAHDFRLPARTR